MAKIILDEKEFERICYEDHEDYEVIEENEGSSSRWTREITLIVKNLKNNKFYKCSYEKGSTEYQEDAFYDTELIEVKQKLVKILKWMVEE